MERIGRLRDRAAAGVDRGLYRGSDRVLERTNLAACRQMVVWHALNWRRSRLSSPVG